MPRYRVYTAVNVTVYIEDGKVTGVDPEGGWHEPDIEVEGDDGVTRSLNIDSDEAEDVLAAMTGHWSVSQE